MARLTIPDEPTFAEFTVVTSTAVFPFSFSIFAKADLSVLVDGVELDQSDFTFTGSVLDGGGYAGGSVTLNEAVEDCEVRVERNVSVARTSLFAPSANVPVGVVDQAINRLTANMQDIERRKLAAPRNPTAGSFLAYDASLQLVGSSGTGADAGLRTDLAAAEGAALLGYDDGGDGAEGLALRDLLQAGPINAASYGITGSGSGDIAKLQAALAHAILTGRKLVIPPGTYQAAGLTAVIDTYLPFAPAFGAGLQIEGAGEGRTILDNRQADGYLLDLTTANALKFIQGGSISKLTITVDSGATVANSGGIRMRRTTAFVLSELAIIGLSGDGLKWRCDDGDPDSNVNVRTNKVRIEGCRGWGWDGAAGPGHNENSFISTTDVAVQNCGTAEETAITGITKANPAVVTSANHGRSNGDIVYIAGVQGMTQVNTGNSEVAYVVAGATTNTFQLTGIDSSGYGSYTSGGHVISARPRSGGVRWKGQISKHDTLSLTINENVSLYVEPGPATAQGLDLSGVVIENPKMVGAIIGGVTMLRSAMGQSYANAAQAGKQCYFGWMIDGTTVTNQHVYIEKHTVRATAADPDYVQWAMCGGENDINTIRVRETAWLAFGYSRQKRFTSQWRFDADFSNNVVCLASDANIAVVVPSATIGQGGRVPIRLRYATGGNSTDGEWVTRYITTVLIPKPVSDGVYNIYLYDNASTTAAEASATGAVLDTSTGYMVKTGDATRTFVGQLAVSGGAWVLSGGQYLAPTPIGGAQPGVPAWFFYNDNDRSLNVKVSATRPTSLIDRNFSFKATFEASKVVNLASIAAGASTTFTLDGTNGVVGVVGDKIIGISASVYSGGLIFWGEFSGDSTITVTAFNPTAGAIDMASATFYLEYQRR